MSNIFYVSRCNKMGFTTRTLISLKDKISISLDEDTIFRWLLKRKVFYEHYKHEFEKNLKAGVLVPVSEESIEKYGVEVEDADSLAGYFIDTTKKNGEVGRIVQREAAFPQLYTVVSKDDYEKIRSISGRGLGVQRITAILGHTHVEVAVFEEGSVPDNELYTLS